MTSNEKKPLDDVVKNNWTIGKRSVVWLLTPSLVIPDDFKTFISGIFLSVAINIATSQIPNKFYDILPLDTQISMLMMFASSVFFMIWNVRTKKIRDEYKKSTVKGIGAWFDYVCPKSKKTNAVLLILCTVMTFCSLLISIILLV